MPKITAPYGSWKSPITADYAASSAIAFSEVAIDGSDIYWLESRPGESGRYTIMRRQPDGSAMDCTPAEFNVRTTVHEYGGGAFAVGDGRLYFANFKDQHLYRQDPGQSPRILTPADGCRYADLVVDRNRHRLICIREDHRGPGEAVNTIVAVDDTDRGDGRILAAGNDFYSSARLSPDGSRLAYLTWNHPNMPWDGCELWVADLDSDGYLHAARRVAGGERESIFQPEWSPEGVLHFTSDRSGWWNLYRWDGSVVEGLCPLEAEFGRSQFQFGMSLFGFVSATRILCAYSRDGSWHLAWLDATSRTLTRVSTPNTEISDMHGGDGFAVFIAGSPASASAVMRMDAQTGRIETLTPSSEGAVDPGYFAVPEPIVFPTGERLQSHGFYYPPTNPQYVSPPGEQAPLLVTSHGGPTGAASTTLSPTIQFWTSRGFALLDVNYGGSIGYGRPYRERLNGRWGVVDVDDCCNGALYLAEAGRVDRARMAVRGRSAGGYTTLACLAFRSGVFSAAASLYGVADLETFAKDTHKFESRYLTSLIGPYPERQDLYVQRSPIHFVGNFACPLILLQGAEDRVVLPSQAQTMYDAVRAAGLPVALLIFPGEQHGFRQAANIRRALEAELYFYSKVFRFLPADPIDPIPIANL